MAKSTLLLLLLWVLYYSDQCSVVQANDQMLDIVSNVHLQLQEKHLYLSWELFKKSGNVHGYNIFWHDRTEEVKHWPAEPNVLPLDFDLETTCFLKHDLSITPYDREQSPIGVNHTVTFTWQDIVTNLTLVPGDREIHASWEIKCLSASLRQFFVTWQSTKSGFERACVFPGEARNTSGSSNCFGKELYPCISYDVSIQAVDNLTADIGIPALKNAFTLPETTFSVEDLKILDQGSTSASLAWKKPNSDCPITEYFFTYSGVALWGDKLSQSGEIQIKGSQNVTSDNQITANLKSYGKDEVVGVFDHIWPYSAYQLCIGFGNIKRNSSKNCIHLQTTQAQPSKPRHLNFTLKNPHTIEVAWQKPEYINGIIMNYFIRLTTDQQPVAVHVSENEFITIDNLMDCVNYKITVTARTAAGEGKMAQINSGTPVEGCDNKPRPTMVLLSSGVALLLLCLGAVSVYVFYRVKNSGSRKTASRVDEGIPLNEHKKPPILMVRDSHFTGFTLDCKNYEVSVVRITGSYIRLKDIAKHINKDISMVVIFGMHSNIIWQDINLNQETKRLSRFNANVDVTDLVDELSIAEMKWKEKTRGLNVVWVLPYPVNFLEYDIKNAGANDPLSGRESETSKMNTVRSIKFINKLKTEMENKNLQCIDSMDVVCSLNRSVEEIIFDDIKWKDDSFENCWKLSTASKICLNSKVEEMINERFESQQKIVCGHQMPYL